MSRLSSPTRCGMLEFIDDRRQVALRCSWLPLHCSSARFLRLDISFFVHISFDIYSIPFMLFLAVAYKVRPADRIMANSIKVGAMSTLCILPILFPSIALTKDSSRYSPSIER